MPSTPGEFKTRAELIDPALQKAGWDVNNPAQVGIEIPVDGFDPRAWQELEWELRQIREKGKISAINVPAGISDYVLYRENGEILAVVEAKKTSIDPRPGERTGDLAAGTCGFLVNAYEHILVKHTSPEILEIDAEGNPHHFIGDRLNDEQRAHLQNRAFRGFDNDSGMTMLRIGSMNLMLHGIVRPQYFYMDTLSKDYTEERDYDVILMNPPFTGKVNKGEVSDTLPSNTTKSELLFVHLILRALDMGGRCAVIVPDGVLFGSSTAHKDLRQKLLDENRLDGVVSMPSGVFKPYAGVSTAILLFTKGAKTEKVWFYDMGHDGFSLDDKRNPVLENDIPDLLACWQNRRDPDFQAARTARRTALQAEIAPLKTERLALQADINRLTFESVIESPLTTKGTKNTKESPEESFVVKNALTEAQTRLATLESQISTLQSPLHQLTRQFWVTPQQIRAHGYDLSASRYRQVEQDPVYYEKPEVTMERLLMLERVMGKEVSALEDLLNE